MCISSSYRKRGQPNLSKIIVTGSSGFIGSNVLNYLHSKGHELIPVDAEIFETRDLRSSFHNFLEYVDAEIIFHIGACSDTLEKNVQEVMLRNYEVTKWVTDWCSRRERALIFSSSAANYGTSGQFPSNLYGWSKYVAEDYVVKSGGIALRYFNVYGPGESKKGKMASFLFQAFESQKLEVPVRLFPGKPMRDFIYVKDIVLANIFAMDNYEHFKGRWYEVSTGVASTFEHLLEVAKIKYDYADSKSIPIGYQVYTRGDPKKWMPGWNPSYSLEEAITEYIGILDGREKS